MSDEKSCDCLAIWRMRWAGWRFIAHAEARRFRRTLWRRPWALRSVWADWRHARRMARRFGAAVWAAEWEAGVRGAGPVTVDD